MEWIAVEVKGQILRMWPDGGEEIRRTLEAGVTLASLVPEIEHTVSLQSHTRILATGVHAGEPLSVPCALGSPRHVPQVDPRLYLAPAVKQDSPVGLIGYEVVRLAGLLAKDPKFDGVACLIGEQTVWVQISAEEIVSFQAAATTKIARQFGVTLTAAPGFEEALSDGMSRPQKLASTIAGLDAAQTLGRMSEHEAAARLTGTLVAAELAAMKPYWLGQRVALIGNPRATGIYEKALTAQGAFCETHLGADLALKGLRLHAAVPA